jgi:hypothetical protein
MTTAATLERRKQDFEKLKYLVDTTKEVGATAIGAIAGAPAFQLIASCVAIELIQNKQVWKGKTVSKLMDHDGTHHDFQTVKVYEPIISQALATSMETAIIAGIAISGLNGSGLFDLLKGFVKK